MVGNAFAHKGVLVDALPRFRQARPDRQFQAVQVVQERCLAHAGLAEDEDVAHQVPLAQGLWDCLDARTGRFFRFRGTAAVPCCLAGPTVVPHAIVLRMMS